MHTDLILEFLNKTSWRMDPPPVFGVFHILAALAAVTAAVLAARAIRHEERKTLVWILFGCGIAMLILETYKQLFLFHIVNEGKYDWWYFPFQLCSVPMYLCLLVPFTRGGLRGSFLTFLAGYTFTGAAAALIYPEDMLRSYISLTAHGFIWHGILLFLSLAVVISRTADLSFRGFGRATLLFGFLSLIAICINIFAEPRMQAAGLPNKYAAMFYLNPYHYSPQPLVGKVQAMLGIPAGLFLYLCVIVIVSAAVTVVFRLLSSRTANDR